MGVIVRNISGTLAAGSASQSLMSANSERKGFWIQNNSATSLWINDMGVAATMAAPCLEVKAGTIYQSPEDGASILAFTIIGATLGQAWAGREW